jgi:mono/diheme cytochrome c family protein
VAARNILTQTVAIGHLRDNDLLYSGLIDGVPADVFPMEVTRAVLERGQQQFNTFCTPCHGFTGYSDGVVVQRGFPPPPSLQDAEIRQKPVGHYYQVMTNGQNLMFSYAARISPEDRWAIAAYLRALQLSQHVDATTLPADLQEQLKAVQ